MKKTLSIILCLAAISVSAVQVAKLNLWDGKAPGAKGDTPADIPDITVYVPGNLASPCAAILICPGGGYSGLCSSYEGHDIAKWLDRFGIAGVVLKYRLNPYRHPVPLQDAQRAMRLVRQHAKEWNIDARRIGVMGFSAGGHLASTLGTHYDKGNAESADAVEHFSSRPDFMVLIYPVITMCKATAHAGSRRNLLGDNPSQEIMEALSNELHVTSDTPAVFLAHSVQDATVSVENSRMFHNAMLQYQRPSVFVEMPKGAHGLGCGKGEDWASWQRACEQWLRKQNLFTSFNLAKVYKMEQKTFKTEDGSLLYCRRQIGDWNTPGKAPVVLLFHGAGERGANNFSQLVWGAKDIIAYCEKHQHKALLLAPQCPDGQQWVDTPWNLPEHKLPPESASMKLAMGMLDTELKTPGVDASRIYVTGLSMGGFGTWDAISRYPDKFAAAFPVCGGVDVEQISRFKNLPLLFYHGDRDTTVLTKRSRDAAAALASCGATNFRYVEVPNCGHGSWIAAFGTEANWEWLFKQKKKHQIKKSPLGFHTVSCFYLKHISLNKKEKSWN